jgi:hypothetical protein
VPRSRRRARRIEIGGGGRIEAAAAFLGAFVLRGMATAQACGRPQFFPLYLPLSGPVGPNLHH